MVCPRCITAVREVLDNLKISFTTVELGEVNISNTLTPLHYEKLKNSLKELGFEVLESEKSTLISKIKALIIEQLHYSSPSLKVNISQLLSEKLNHDYSYLSRLFSSTEGLTIERYIAKQKIERIKEQLFYSGKTLSEIAFEMNYSSVAYLSTQFKKETGMTPSEFKRLKHPKLLSIDKL